MRASINAILPGTRPTMPAAAEPIVKPTTWLEVELGDSDVTVIEYPDGMFKLEIDGGETLLNAEQMQAVTAAFMAMRKAKGWRR